MVDALLDVVRAEAGELRARPEPTDVAVLTEDTASMFRAAAEGAGLALVLDIAPVTAELDQEMWDRIVLNLVSNAVKFTPAGTVTVTLRVRRRPRADRRGQREALSSCPAGNRGHERRGWLNTG